MTNNEIADKAHQNALEVSGASMDRLPWTIAQAQSYASANQAARKLLREDNKA